jgi:SAM-dependent methyltransferase
MNKISIQLHCPRCKGKLSGLHCTGCGVTFPVTGAGSIPVLINEANSIFSFDDYTGQTGYSFFSSGKPKARHMLYRLMPAIGYDMAEIPNYTALGRLLSEKGVTIPRVLVVGTGCVIAKLRKYLPDVEFTFTDVSLTEGIHLICDGHDLPFAENVFDAVICIAVLEHVIDPARCVEEMHRVLKVGGIVYAETPFMQQVHGGAYDFTRFTWLGHMRLFRRFEEISSDVCCGPGMALAWAWKYFLISFAKNGTIRFCLIFFAAWTSFFWKYFDRLLKKNPRSRDAASGVFFMGTKKEGYLLNDRELIKRYS